MEWVESVATNKEWWDNLIGNKEWWDQFRETKEETTVELQEIVMPEKVPKELKPFNVYENHRSVSQKEQLRDERTKEYIGYINKNHKDQSYNIWSRDTYAMFDSMGSPKYINSPHKIEWSFSNTKKVRTYEDTKNLSFYVRFPSDGDDADIPYWERAPVFFRVIIKTGEPIQYWPYSEVVSVGYYEAVDESGYPIHPRITTVHSRAHKPSVDISPMVTDVLIKRARKKDNYTLPTPKKVRDPEQGRFRKGRSAEEILAEEYAPPVI